MRKSEIKLPLTPITENTFKRQGWIKHTFSTTTMSVDELDEMDDDDDDITPSDPNSNEAYFYILPIPKARTDNYAPLFVSNASNELSVLKEMGINPENFFVEIMNMDGLGYCDTEEDLEILYRALTGDDINAK